MSSSQAGGASSATRQIFHALITGADGAVSSQYFLGFLTRQGLLARDPRLKGLYESLGKLNAVDADVALTLEQFDEAIDSCTSLVHKAVTGALRVPSFEQVSQACAEVYEKVLPNKGGMNAQYIKQLAQVDPEQFAISVTSVDGQHFSIGDMDNEFCIQSCSKPISYLIAQDIYGAEYVHHHVGTEPSGRAFNEMCLKDKPSEEQPDRKIPHNPCINAGAIMAVSMVHPDLTRAERHEKVLNAWRRLSGPDAPIGYDEDTYVSESADASRNWCLGYMMMNDHSFPDTLKTAKDLEETLELYFMICSTLSTNRAMSTMASTMANGGLNPLSGERVFKADQVRNALPIMMMAGMYDYSGQWAFDIGVPAKSGVGGCVFIVVPNVCGISIWSPRLDAVGNSERGVKASTALGEIFQLNSFDVFSGLSRTKIDPRKRKNADAQAQLGGLLFAASEGDTQALSAEFEAGCDLTLKDYDDRTALHLAAAEGHATAVDFILSKIGSNAAAVNKTDRWGGTALDDALHNNHTEVAEMIKAAGGTAAVAGKRGSVAAAVGATLHVEQVEISADEVISADAPMVLFAAADGDVDQLVKFRASGVDLFMRDYDHRTALHLAASNGRADAVQYLLAQAGDNAKAMASAQDRWGATPQADCVREGEKSAACKTLLDAALA